MKIMFVSPGCFDKGGISRYNRYQIQLLREQFGEENVRVFSLLGPDANSFEGEYKVYWNGNGVSGKDKLGLFYQIMTNAITWRPNIIWLGHVNLSGLGKVAAKICGAYSILNAYGLEIWSKMRRDAAWGLRNTDHIIADCHNTADYLVDKSIRKRSDISVVWDCIDTERFFVNNNHSMEVLAKYNIPDPSSHFIILSLGRLAKPDAYYKGYDRLLRVFGRLYKSFPQIRLVFAGRGNYREDLEKMRDELGLNDVVSFTGSVTEDDLARVYQSCHVFSLVTESGEGKGEGIPLTPLEAMACGKPILVGNDDGSREAVIDHKNGFVLDTKDEAAQEQAIKTYIENPQLFKEHSENAARFAIQYFSYGRFKNETLSVISNKVKN